MVAVPKRLEDAVGKAQHKDVLDRLFAKEMIDPIDLIFAQDSQDPRIERARRGEIVAERLFDDNPAPTVARLAGEPGTTQLLDNGAGKIVGKGKVEQHVDVDLFGALLQHPSRYLSQ